MHKTVIGFALGVAVAVAATFAQSRIDWANGLVNYDHWLTLGLACGCGALGGDALKSFLKRRLDIAPGQSWDPGGSLDFVLGGLIGLSFFAPLDLTDVVVILVASLVGASSSIMCLLRSAFAIPSGEVTAGTCLRTSSRGHAMPPMVDIESVDFDQHSPRLRLIPSARGTMA